VGIHHGLLAERRLVRVAEETLQVRGQEVAGTRREGLPHRLEEGVRQAVVGTRELRGHGETDHAFLVGREGIGHVSQPEEDAVRQEVPPRTSGEMPGFRRRLTACVLPRTVRASQSSSCGPMRVIFSRMP